MWTKRKDPVENRQNVKKAYIMKHGKMLRIWKTIMPKRWKTADIWKMLED